MIAEIFPLETSHDATGLSYFVPESLRDIAVGQLVEIPFRDEIAHGIVASVSEYSGEIPDEVRSIIRIVFPVPVLDVSQIAAIREIAKSSVVHLHKVVALFLPKPILQRMLKYGIASPEAATVRDAAPKPVLHFLKDAGNLIAYLAQIDSKRTAYVVPSDWYASRLKVLLNQEKLGILDGELTDTKRAQLWLDIRAGKYETLIWTRRLCTYNLAGFDRIVYVEDSIMKELLHSFHRYSSLDIAERIARHAGQELHVVSATPSVGILARTLASQFELVNA